MPNRGGLAVYVTSHGFGHLNRTVAVLNRIPADLPIAIRCKPDLFAHWRERLTRPADFEPHLSDVGALNPPGDSALTDGPGTLALAERVHREAVGRIDEDVAALRDGGTAAVLCDAPAVPLLAARRAGVPGFLLANFTWAEIYRPHARLLGENAVKFVKELHYAYRSATVVFRAQPALAMKGLGAVENVGLVVAPGRNRRAELCSRFGISGDEKIVYFYVGRYGRAGLGWERLGRMNGVQFVGFHPAPGVSMPNFHVAPPSEWTGADLAASADAIVAKAGYGTACEAMSAGTPIIYPPRAGFAEHRALDRALKAWGGGIPATSRQFGELRLERPLSQALQTNPGPVPFRMDGAEVVARRLVEVCRTCLRPSTPG